MRAQIFIVLTLVLMAGAARAEDAGGPRERTEAFLARVGKGEIAPAYDDLFAGSPIVAAKPQALDALKRQTTAGLPLYGKVLGFELQNEKKFGASIVRLTYIQKLEQHPLVWRFWFYKPGDAWLVDNVAFNDQFNYLQGDQLRGVRWLGYALVRHAMSLGRRDVARDGTAVAAVGIVGWIVLLLGAFEAWVRRSTS